MRRDQGYNISKIQPGTTYFDMTSAHNTKIWSLQMNTFFFKIDSVHIKNGTKKIIERSDFVEKKILYRLKRSAPQTDEIWVKKSQNTNRSEKIVF